MGIDLIEIKKAKRLYRAHKKRLGSFFSLKEITYIEKSAKPHENLAVLLASKEAVFKAMSRFGTGLAVFRNIEMVPGKKEGFSLRLRKTFKNAHFNFSILKNRKYVVVQCAGT